MSLAFRADRPSASSDDEIELLRARRKVRVLFINDTARNGDAKRGSMQGFAVQCVQHIDLDPSIGSLVVGGSVVHATGGATHMPAPTRRSRCPSGGFRDSFG